MDNEIDIRYDAPFREMNTSKFISLLQISLEYNIITQNQKSRYVPTVIV